MAGVIRVLCLDALAWLMWVTPSFEDFKHTRTSRLEMRDNDEGYVIFCHLKIAEKMFEQQEDFDEI